MTTLTIDIRKAEPRDADAIADVHQAAWRGTYAGIIPHRALNGMLGRRGPQWWAHAIRRATSILVVDMGGKVAGYATIGRNRARELPQQGEIYKLYLRPECQGIGLGTLLSAAARPRPAAHHMNGHAVCTQQGHVGALDFYAGAGGRDIAEGVEVFDQKALRKIAFAWD